MGNKTFLDIGAVIVLLTVRAASSANAASYTFTEFDYPLATYTKLDGINNDEAASRLAHEHRSTIHANGGARFWRHCGRGATASKSAARLRRDIQQVDWLPITQDDAIGSGPRIWRSG